jgi:phage/plasmid-associated DNA primase
MTGVVAKDSDWKDFCVCGRNQHDATEATHIADEVKASWKEWRKARDKALERVEARLDLQLEKIMALESEARE